MKQMIKKALACLLAFIMAFSLSFTVLPTTALAEDAAVSAVIDPITAAFDKYAPNQADVITNITWNDAAYVTGVSKGEDPIGSENYVTGASTLTITKEYLAAQAVGELVLTVMFDAGDPAVLTIMISDTTPVNAVIDPALAAFDKYVPNQADVISVITFNSANSVVDVKAGKTSIGSGYYLAGGDTLVITKGYLAEQAVGELDLTVVFDVGDPATLTISISDTTPVNAVIDPAAAAFDKYAPNQADVITNITWNDAVSITDVKAGENSIGSENYVPGESTLTIAKEYLAEQAVGELTLTVVFDVGDPATLTISISETVPINSVAVDIDAPAAGAVPDTEAAVNTTCVTASDVAWTPADDPFGYYTAYIAGMTLTADAGYEFTAETGVTVNGDTAGVTLNGDGTLTVTYEFAATDPLNAVIDPAAAAFDKRLVSQSDVSAAIVWNSATKITDVKAGDVSIGSENYDLSDNTLIIKKEYLAAQPLGELVLTVEFNVGSPAALTITICDTTVSAVIDPASAVFDKDPAKQADISTVITLNDAVSVADVKAGETSIGAENYGYVGNTLTIKKEYLAAQAEGELILTVMFDIGGPAVMTITITDTTPFCEIGTTQYHTLDEALAAVLNNQTKTIRLLDNINYNKGMSISTKTVIFDLNGYTLNVINMSGNALTVGTGGVVYSTGDGEFNVIGSGTGVLAFLGGKAIVTNAASTGSSGAGAVANNKDSKGKASYAEVTNDAVATGSGSTGARATSGGRVLIRRNAEGVFKAAEATNIGSLAEVSGNAKATGTNGYAVFAYDGGRVSITGDVEAGDGYYGVTSNSGTAWVGGSVKMGGVGTMGVWANGTGAATIEGAITASTYIRMQASTDLAPSAGVPGTGANAGYLVYTGGNGIVRVKNPVSPANTLFDRNPAIQADVSTVVTWYSSTQVTDVKAGGTSIGGENYGVDGSTLTIKKEYLAAQAVGDLILTVEFNAGAPAKLTVTISDTTPFCEIGTVQFHTLEQALATILSGETKTVKLLDNLDHNKGIVVNGKTIIFDLNGYTLSVLSSAGSGLEVSNGTVNISGSGTFNITSNGLSVGSGGLVDLTGSGTLNVTSSAGDGINAENGGVVDITGSGSINAFASACFTNGVYAHSGGQVKVTNAASINAAGFENCATGVCVDGTDSRVEVMGDAESDMDCVTGVVYAVNGGVAIVHGSVTGGGTDSLGVNVYDGGEATVEGTITALNYILMQDVAKNAADGLPGTGEDGSYIIYTDGSNIVRVKNPVSPSRMLFDKDPDDQKDVSTNITWNDATRVTGIKEGAASIGSGNYVTDGDTLTIKKEYLATMPMGDHILTVEFDAGAPAKLAIRIKTVNLTVTFNAAGGSVGLSSVQAYYREAYGELPVPKRSGYYFFGWYTGQSGSGDLIEADSIVNTTSDITLYARWVKNSLLALSTPSLTAKAADYKTITLTWKAVKGAEGYEIWKKTGGTYQHYADTDASTLSYTDKDLTAGTYYYKVRAYHTPYIDKVYSSLSSYKSAKPAWQAISLKAASNSYNSIKLTWNEIDGAEGYYVYRSTSYKGPFDTSIDTVLKGTEKTISYTDDNKGTGLTSGKTYYYRIKAYNGTEYSSLSSYKYAKPAWPAVSFEIAAYTYNSIKLTWNKVEGAAAYDVLRSEKYNGNYTKISDLAGLTVTNFEDTTVVKGKTYYYKVKAYVSDTEYKQSGYKSAKAAWQAISLKAVSNSYNSIKLTWNEIEGAEGYYIYRSTSYKGPFDTSIDTVLKGTEKTISYTDDNKGTGLTSGKTYYYRIKAYNGTEYSSLSSYKYAKPAWPAIKLTAASNSCNSVKLTWNVIAGATAYEVQRYNSTAKSYVKIAGDPADLDFTADGYVSYTDHSLSTGVKYYYKIKAYDGDKSTLSGSKYAVPVPSAPTGVTAGRTDAITVRVSWDKVEGADTYAVYRATSSSGTYSCVGKTSELSLDNTGLYTGKNYYYKVKAYTNGVYGPYSEKKYA